MGGSRRGDEEMLEEKNKAAWVGQAAFGCGIDVRA